MSIFTDLNELNLAAEMIDDFLIAFVLPPLDSYVLLATGGDNPERSIPPRYLMHLREPRLLLGRYMDITFEGRRFDG